MHGVPLLRRSRREERRTAADHGQNGSGRKGECAPLGHDRLACVLLCGAIT
jgi:hypothetical protein